MNLPVEILEGVIDDALFDVYRKIPSITGDLRKARIADPPVTKTPW